MKRLISISFDFDSDGAGAWQKNLAATTFCEDTHGGIRATKSQWLIYTELDVARIAEDFVKAIGAEGRTIIHSERNGNTIEGGDHLLVSYADGAISVDPHVRRWISDRADPEG